MKLKNALMHTAVIASALVTGLTQSLSAYAAPLKTKYISDIRTVCALSADDAKAKFAAEGYTMLETDVNPTLDKSVYIGYKTSYNINEAIRGLNFMDMHGKYSFSEYQDVLKNHRDVVENNIDGMIPTIEAYRAAYEKGTENALHAYEMLNHVFDMFSGEYMGDFLLHCELKRGKRDALTDAFMKGNANIVTQMQKLMTLAAQSEKASWLDRFEQASTDELTERYTNNFYSASRAQKALTQDFFADASVIWENHWDDLYDTIQFVENDLSVTQDGDYDASAVADEIGEMIGEPETVEEKQQANTLIASTLLTAQNAVNVYSVLEQYEYNGAPMLDFFNRPHTEVEIEELYPLLDSLSAGERGCCQTVGLADLITQAAAEDHWDAEREDYFKLWSDGSGEVSLYEDVNLKAYEEGVALTSAAAKRRQTIGNVNSKSFWQNWWKLFKNPSLGENEAERFTRTFTFLQLGGVAVCGMLFGSVLVAVANVWFKQTIAAASQSATNGIKLIFQAATWKGAEGSGIGALLTNPGQTFYSALRGHWKEFTKAGNVIAGLGQCLLSLFYILLVISLVVSIFMVFNDMWHTATYTNIPVAMCDAWQGGSFTDYILYEAVEGLDPTNMAYGDVNGYVEQYGDTAGLISESSVGWLVLYFTKDENAGQPLTELKITTGEGSTPLGFEGVTMFGSGNAVSMTDKNYTGQSNDPQIKLYCKRAAAPQTSSVATKGAYAAIAAVSALGGCAVGALLGLRRKKKQPVEPVSASN